MEIFITKSIQEKLKFSTLTQILKILENRKNEKIEIDYLQIFKIEKNKIINSQKIPKYEEEYKLKTNEQNKKIIWAIKDIDPIVGEYWTILFPKDY